MSILTKLTMLFNDQIVNCLCYVCGNKTNLLGFDFGINDVPDQEPCFVCHQCTENLRPDLLKIQRAAFEFANSGLAQDCGDAGKTAEDMVMPWMRGTTREQAAAPAAPPLMTGEEYRSEKHAQNLEIECAPIVRALVEARLEDRQGLSSQDIECLEFYLKNQIVVFRP